MKQSLKLLAFIYADQFRKHRVTAVSVTPGFLRSEAMLEHFGVTEANWKEAVKKDKNFAVTEGFEREADWLERIAARARGYANAAVRVKV